MDLRFFSKPVRNYKFLNFEERPEFGLLLQQAQKIRIWTADDTFVSHFSCEAKGEPMRRYRQLEFEDRIYIEVWQLEKVNQTTIAKRLGVHRSTISRELRRGKSNFGRLSYQAHLGKHPPQFSPLRVLFLNRAGNSTTSPEANLILILSHQPSSQVLRILSRKKFKSTL